MYKRPPVRGSSGLVIHCMWHSTLSMASIILNKTYSMLCFDLLKQQNIKHSRSIHYVRADITQRLTCYVTRHPGTVILKMTIIHAITAKLFHFFQCTRAKLGSYATKGGEKTGISIFELAEHTAPTNPHTHTNAHSPAEKGRKPSTSPKTHTQFCDINYVPDVCYKGDPYVVWCFCD